MVDHGEQQKEAFGVAFFRASFGGFCVWLLGNLSAIPQLFLYFAGTPAALRRPGAAAVLRGAQLSAVERSGSAAFSSSFPSRVLAMFNLSIRCPRSS